MNPHASDRGNTGRPSPPLTRRSVLQRLLVVGGAGLLAACAPAAQPAPTPPPAKPTSPPAAPTAAAKTAPSPTAAPSPAASGAGPVSVGGFPSKPLRIMAPAAPGGGWDGTSRKVQEVLQGQKIAAQNVEVFNRPGAGGTVGLAELVNQNRGDGHTVMTMGLVMTGAILTNKSPVSLSQTTPLARLTTEFEAIAVATGSKYQTIQQLMEDFKKNPRAVKWGGGSAGGTDHIAVGLVAQALGVGPKDVNYIAFSGGGELMPQVLGNQVSAGISGISEFKGQADAGKLRILAVTGPSRLPGTNAPTLKESGVNVELTNWRGLVGPPAMPDNARQAWLAMLSRLHETAAWKEILQKQDWTDAFLAGDPFAQFLKEEDARVSQVLKEIGLVQ